MSNSRIETGLLWVYPKEDPKWLQTIIHEFRIHPVTAQILVSRGFADLEEIHQFLYGKLPNLLNPNLFKDMDNAVKRIIAAMKDNEGILIYGDNDVDGMTSAALLVDFLSCLGTRVDYYVPNRSSVQKNPLQDAMHSMIKKQFKLLITVDCGITAAKEIDEIVENGIDVIITDHHEPTSKIPRTVATLNPKLINSTYPNREITGVGIAFKLAHALTNYLSEHESKVAKKIDLKTYLDLVALGTLADMGALQGENRILVQYGLKELKKTKRVGLRKLFNICELVPSEITTMDIASKIAPRLNSLGRIADPTKGVELLLIKDEKQAEGLAQELDSYNQKRQKIEREASEDVERSLKTYFDANDEKAIVLSSENWHPGIIPILAARIAKQYNRPTVIIAIENGVGKGSIRTIPEYPLLDVLKDNRDLLINFGGHDFAAGLTIQEKDILPFKKNFLENANMLLKDQDIQSKLYLDAQINFTDLTFDFMESLSLLEPYGNGNAPPTLYSDAKQSWAPKTVGKSHLKVFLEQNDRLLEGIGFGMALRKAELKKKNAKMRICFTPHITTYMKKASIQLQLKDFKLL